MVLTRRQLDFIEYLLANPRVPDYTCADRYGIPRSTLHDWKNRPEFMDELRKHIMAEHHFQLQCSGDLLHGLCEECTKNSDL